MRKEVLVDDFNTLLNNTPPTPDPVYPYDHGELVNRLGGEINVTEGGGPGSHQASLDYDESVRVGAEGYSMKIHYEMGSTNKWAGFWTALDNLDIRMFNTLSFWVKGTAGGEKFVVSLRPETGNPQDDEDHETRISILDYLPKGVNTQWQKVSIPLAAFTKLRERDKEVDILAMTFIDTIGSANTGTIYVDDIKFERTRIPTSVFVDDFTDDISLNALQGTIGKYNTPTGATIDWVYDSATYDGTGRCARITYSVTEPSAYAEWHEGLYGADVSSQNTLVFYIKGTVGAEVNVYLEDGVVDPNTHELKIINRRYVDLEDYVAIKDDKWQMVRIPLSAFSRQGIDLSRLQTLLFAFEWQNMSGSIYVDDIQFVSYGEIVTPTLDPLPSIVNTSPIILSGTKGPGTAIYVNGTKAVDIDNETIWSCQLGLVDGANTIKMTARDDRGAESNEIVATITLDRAVHLTPPPASYIKIVNDPENQNKLDSTINVTVTKYSVADERFRHTGYAVEISDSASFTPKLAVYNYWNSPTNKAIDAKPIDSTVSFDIDVNSFVGTGKTWTTLPANIYTRVRAIRNYYEPSVAVGNWIVNLSSTVLLDSPKSATLLNSDFDPIVQVEITPKPTLERTAGNAIETGYRIDFLPGNKNFDTTSWENIYHVEKAYTGSVVKFEVDFRTVVESGLFTWSEISANRINARAYSIKKGFTQSSYSSAGPVTVKNITRLQNPMLDKIQLANAENDRVITVKINKYDPVNFGKTDTVLPDVTITNKKDIRHAGYRIDICQDTGFGSKTYTYNYTFDYEGDGLADEIKSTMPEDATIDIDLEPARGIFKEFYKGGKVFVRIFAAREGYALNSEYIRYFNVNFYDTTKLQNPGPHTRVYNKEPGSTSDKWDRTITVEIENYDPSGITSGNNSKNMHHTGYRVDISGSTSGRTPVFNEGSYYSYYYTYDPDKDGVGNEISSAIPDNNVKIHIDLDAARKFWNSSYIMYVRVIATRPGYAVNYDDITTPWVPFADRSFLARPGEGIVPPANPATVLNPTNSNAYTTDTDKIDSSVRVDVNKTIPASIVHEGYAVKVEVTGADGKKYSKMFDITGLKYDVSEPSKIAIVTSTIDVKKLFERDIPYIGIADNEKKAITADFVSTKPGYTNSAPATPTPLSSSFKNTSNSYFEKKVTEVTTMIVSSNPTGTAKIQVVFGSYPTTPPKPLPPGSVKCEVQCSSDSTFPNNESKTITAYTQNLSTTTTTTTNVDATTLLATATGNDIYVRARFVKDGYTSGVYTTPSTIHVTILPPIAEFSASPARSGLVSLNVGFTWDDPTHCGGPSTTYSWNFGDPGSGGNNTSTLANPNHTYNTSGRYDVTLFVTGPSGSHTVTKAGYIIVANIMVDEEDEETIQHAIGRASSGNVVLIPYISGKTYEEDITIDKDITLISEDLTANMITGNIVVKNSKATLDNLNIFYDQGIVVTGSDYKIQSNAGITAINATEITVKNCYIQPSDVFGEAKYGNGIQILNLSGSGEIKPVIENNLVSNADVGVYVYSHSSGGAISAEGKIKNNTLFNTNYGVVFRMHKENLRIQDNIFTNVFGDTTPSPAESAIHITYQDGTLLDNRLNNIIGNVFFNNKYNVWCDELQKKFTPLPQTGTWEYQGNIYEDPELDDYSMPLNPDCEGKGYSIP